MNDYNFNNFSDYDPFHTENESGTNNDRENYRPLTRSSREQRRKARRRKRIINRTIILTAFGLVIILICTIISSIFKSCSSGNQDTNSSESPSENSQPSSNDTPDVPSEPNIPLSALDFVTPNIADDNTNGSFSSNIYIYKNAGYTAFSATAQDGADYAQALLRYKDNLPSNVNVYSIIVPSATEIRLPPRLAAEAFSASSQAEFIKSAYAAMGNKITTVNVYNALANHNDEYIYFNTDSHWTALGAYYGYTAFTEAAGLTPVDISTLSKSSISGFTGDYAAQTGSTQLNSNPDTVDYYEYSEDAGIKCKMLFENGGELQPSTLYYPGASSGSLTYGVFIWADLPFFYIETANNTGKNILVVKDSYGNPFVPYLASNYDHIHVIDYRRWDGNIKQYCSENNITDVLFINEVANASSSSQIDTMDTLFN